MSRADIKLDPQAIVLFMTAYADTDKAVRAIKVELLTLFPTLGKRKTTCYAFIGYQTSLILVKRSGN